MKYFIKKLIKYYIFNLPHNFKKIPTTPKRWSELLHNLDNLALDDSQKVTGPDRAWLEFSKKFVGELRGEATHETFLRAPTILATMNEVLLPNLISEYISVKNYLQVEGYDASKILEENSVGGQIPFILNRSSSGNLIHHIYHLTEFQKFSEVKISQFLNVYEIGAGYGSMYRVIRKFEFLGQYSIYDLPLFAELQKFYLGAISLFEEGKLTWNESIKNQKIKPGSLLIATWSLSEINIDKREKYQTLLNECDYFLIGFRDTFEGVNNLTYFEDLMKKRPDLQFDIRKITGIKNSYYLFAKPLSKRA